MKKYKMAGFLTMALVFLVTGCSGTEDNASSNPPLNMANPASVYCDSVGGTSETRKDEKGNVMSMCHLPDGAVVEEWTLYRNNHGDNTK
ncbi:putative hemolysin [Enterovibrio norvegicus]|uniref:putative hemolysin n=1 Tax=Enterovibrio norvegicus TaxID=188144 RepID=UPI00354E8D51